MRSARASPRAASSTPRPSSPAALFADRRESVENEAGDFLLAAEEAGLGPEHIRAELGELLTGEAEGRRSDDELTVFKSLGLAVEDLAAAALCVERARRDGTRRRGRLLIPLAAIEAARERIADVAMRRRSCA